MRLTVKVERLSPTGQNSDRIHDRQASMRKVNALQSAAEKMGVSFLELPLTRVALKRWSCPPSSTGVSVEKAVLDHFANDGWRGYAGEGGLVLNLIKAMSFASIPVRLRAMFTEAIYAQNVAFTDDMHPASEMLAQVAVATPEQVGRNFDVMASRQALEISYREHPGFTSMLTSSMLDYFPGIERWMFLELQAVAGNELLHRIASKFAQSPYDFRRGWPDITMWKEDQLKFLEVKAPGDRVIESQKVIVSEFAVPLQLDFSLVGVTSAAVADSADVSRA